jgi:hypothetical protein
VRHRGLRAAVFACAILFTGLTAPAPAATAPADDDAAYCTVAVATVAPVGSDGTTQGVILMPTVAGSATLTGTLALFTADGRRYSVPFGDTLVTSAGSPTVLLYRFPRPVEVTGAYVSALGGSDGGACAVAYPWSKQRATPSAKLDRAIANVAPSAPVTAVADTGTADALACSDPDRAPRAKNDARALSIPYAHGRVVVLVTIAPDGKPVNATVVSSDPSLNDGGTGNEARADAVRIAMHSDFEPATFRCRPIIEPYDFVVEYN